MLRHDGDFVIYILQHQFRKTGEWANSGDGEQFCKNKKPFTEEPRRSFNACGSCWQQTGVQGSFDKKIAFKMMILCACETPKHNYRIKQVTISQSSDIITQTF